MKKVSLFLTLLIAATLSFAQTTTVVAVDPAGAGGFESAGTIAGNGWTVVGPTGNNAWNVGSVPGVFAGSNCAYISNTSGTTYNYARASLSRTYFYRDIAIPATATAINLSFYYKGAGENSTPPDNWDQLIVFHAPTSFTPVNTAPVGTASTLAGATTIFASSEQSTVAWTQVTATIPVAA